jgi:hypothetical protein
VVYAKPKTAQWGRAPCDKLTVPYLQPIKEGLLVSVLSQLNPLYALPCCSFDTFQYPSNSRFWSIYRVYLPCLQLIPFPRPRPADWYLESSTNHEAADHAVLLWLLFAFSEVQVLHWLPYSSTPAVCTRKCAVRKSFNAKAGGHTAATVTCCCCPRMVWILVAVSSNISTAFSRNKTIKKKQCLCNVTMRRVHEILVAVEKQ